MQHMYDAYNAMQIPCNNIQFFAIMHYHAIWWSVTCVCKTPFLVHWECSSISLRPLFQNPNNSGHTHHACQKDQPGSVTHCDCDLWFSLHWMEHNYSKAFKDCASVQYYANTIQYQKAVTWQKSVLSFHVWTSGPWRYGSCSGFPFLHAITSLTILVLLTGPCIASSSAGGLGQRKIRSCLVSWTQRLLLPACDGQVKPS